MSSALRSPLHARAKPAHSFPPRTPWARTLPILGAFLFPLAASAQATAFPRDHLLLYLANPDIAVLLLLTGALLICLEAHTPGTILPGALGLLCVLLAVYGFQLHPVSAFAVLLLTGALALLMLEIKLPSRGLLAAFGTVFLVYGLRTLIPGDAGPHVHTATALSAGLSFAAILFFLAWLGVQARRNKSLSGAEAMLGLVAIARTPLTPAGQVEVRGELWQATLSAGVAAPGDRVTITAMRGLTLTVRPLV